MSKRIAGIEAMADKAMNIGEAHWTHYRVENDSDEFCMYHYGTLILKYDWVESKVTSTGGAYSASDRDAINTVLTYCLKNPRGEYSRIKDGCLEVVAL